MSFCSRHLHEIMIVIVPLYSVCCSIKSESDRGRAEKRPARSLTAAGLNFKAFPCEQRDKGWREREDGVNKAGCKQCVMLDTGVWPCWRPILPNRHQHLWVMSCCPLAACVCVCSYHAVKSSCVYMPHWRHTKLTITAQAIKTKHTHTHTLEQPGSHQHG